MGEAFLDYKKGGSFDINGIIKDYYVNTSKTVNTGDFVEFVEGVSGQTTTTSTVTGEEAKIASITNRALNYYGTEARGVALSDTKALVIYTKDEAYVANTNLLYGVILTIDAGKITVGTETSLGIFDREENIYGVKALSSTKVIIAHSTDYVYATICTISGTTITVEKTTKIDSNDNASDISVEFISDTQVCMTYVRRESSVDRLCSVVCTVSGSNIILGTIYEFGTDSDNDMKTMVTAKNNSGQIRCAVSADGQPYGTTLTISGTVISGSAIHRLHSRAFEFFEYVAMSSIPNSNSTVLVHKYGYLVCTLNFNVLEDNMSSSINYPRFIHVIGISTTKAMIFYSDYGSYSDVLRVAFVNPSTNTLLQNTILNTANYSGYSNIPIQMPNGDILIVYPFLGEGKKVSDKGYDLYGKLYRVSGDTLIDTFTKTNIVTNYETQVRPATSMPCKGIAQTSGTGGDSTKHKDKVSIYVPDV